MPVQAIFRSQKWLLEAETSVPFGAKLAAPQKSFHNAALK